MTRRGQSLREFHDGRRHNGGTTYGIQRFQKPIIFPPVIPHADRQTSMRLTLDHMVELNNGYAVAVSIPAAQE